MLTSPKFSMRLIASLSMIMVVVVAGFVLMIPNSTQAATVLKPKITPRLFHFPARKPSHIAATNSSLPNWSSSFTNNGRTYPYTMVGTNPMNKGAGTTTIPVTIVPIKLTFSNNVTLDGTQKVQNTTASPIFTPAKFAKTNNEITQYGDAIQRAEFWNSVSKTSPNYHVLLGTPTVLKTTNWTIPAANGSTTTTGNGKTIGLVDIDYFDARIQALSATYHFTPNMLPIFLTYNVFLYQGNPNNCCTFGYHNAVGTQTYIWSTYNDPGIFGTLPIEDINGLSHEVAEWLNDPFITNIVPSWSVPSQPQYGCTNVLEVGDPLVGVTFDITLGSLTYHPQDEAFISWFARLSPSRSISHHYTYLDKFKTYSPPC